MGKPSRAAAPVSGAADAAVAGRWSSETHLGLVRRARRMNRKIKEIPAAVMEAFSRYCWPGNVRELQNFIERAVILSQGELLRAPLSELEQMPSPAQKSMIGTLKDLEREQILQALREAGWVIGGPNGAAARLGMKRTTLAYRIRKLKIPV